MQTFVEPKKINSKLSSDFHRLILSNCKSNDSNLQNIYDAYSTDIREECFAIMYHSKAIETHGHKLFTLLLHGGYIDKDKEYFIEDFIDNDEFMEKLKILLAYSLTDEIEDSRRKYCCKDEKDYRCNNVISEFDLYHNYG